MTDFSRHEAELKSYLAETAATADNLEADLIAARQAAAEAVERLRISEGAVSDFIQEQRLNPNTDE